MSKKQISLLSSVLVLAFYYFTSLSTHQSILGVTNTVPVPSITQPVSLVSGTFVVTKVVDGDTIKVTHNTNTFTVRLIGVDTPETVDPRKTVQCFGKEASSFTKTLVQGKTVTLQADTTQENVDKYKRLLRYVFLEDGTNVNQKIISEGYGYEYTYDVPYRYQKEFKDAQDVAMRDGKGLWSNTTCSGKR